MQFRGIYFITPFLICLFMVCASKLAFPGEDDLQLPVEVFQAIRKGVKSVSFKNEYVKLGIPFPEGVVKDLNGRAGLAVENTDFQTRVLKKWPDGSVKWALVEFLATVNKGNKAKKIIISGTGISSGKNLATDRSQSIWVDTGPLQAEIKKTGFNIFNRVVVDGQDILEVGNSKGVVLVDAKGNEFLSSNCKDSRVFIEENGPVKATIRIEGCHCFEETNLLYSTTRLFFYKGKRNVKVQYTLKNASKNYARHVFIKSLDLCLKPINDEGAKVTVSTHKGSKSFDLQKGDIDFYQAVSDFPWRSDGSHFYYNGPVSPDFKREKQRGYKQEGYWIWQDKKIVFEGKRNEYPDLGFMDISDSKGRGVTAGIRYMAGHWPKALKADTSGNLIVSLWPEENERGYWIRYGSHNTYEVMYSFHSKPLKDPKFEIKRFQYPLVARVPVDWWNKNVEGVCPLYNFVSSSEERKVAEKLGIKYKVGWRKPKFQVWRYHYWGHGGFLNQHDFARISLVNFLRHDKDLLKAGEFYLLAESMFNYYADWAVYHSDDYDYSKIQYNPKDNKGKAGLAKVVFEWEHQHWYGMPLYYYMTGDERIKEAAYDLGDYIKKLSNPLSLTYMRVFGTGMFSLAAMYEFTGNQEFLRLADMNFKRLLDVESDPKEAGANRFVDRNRGHIFIDWKRGYVAGGSGSGWPGIKADLMLGSLLYDGLLNYYFQINDKNPLKEKAYDVLTGISEFMFHEPYFEDVKGKRNRWAHWIPYIYNLQDRNKSNHGYKLAGQASFWFVLPYLSTGEKRWINKSGKLVKMAMDDEEIWGSFGFIDHPGYQAISYFLLNKEDYPEVNPVDDLHAEFKEGRIYLSWTVPENNIDGYGIKYSDKNIVDYLQYDPSTKTFKYDPEIHINWWAADNVVDEPRPLPQRSTQTYSLKLKKGQYYFAIKTKRKNMEGKMSNVVKVIVP